MLAIRLRDNPQRDLPTRSSGKVVALTLPSFTSTLIGEGTVHSSLPFGPSTRTVWPFTSTLVLAGISTGFLPIRDIAHHHTYANSSPPTFAFLASWPVMIPREVVRIE